MIVNALPTIEYKCNHDGLHFWENRQLIEIEWISAKRAYNENLTPLNFYFKNKINHHLFVYFRQTTSQLCPGRRWALTWLRSSTPGTSSGGALLLDPPSTLSRIWGGPWCGSGREYHRPSSGPLLSPWGTAAGNVWLQTAATHATSVTLLLHDSCDFFF